jgi:hypothetical protein
VETIDRSPLVPEIFSRVRAPVTLASWMWADTLAPLVRVALSRRWSGLVASTASPVSAMV